MMLLAGSIFTGCSKKINDFGDLNVNPNGATTPPTSALLTNVLSGLGGVPSNTNNGFYVQYYTELQYPGNALYLQTAASWDAFYTGPLEDIQKIISICTTTPNAALLNGNPVNQIQIARILKAYHFAVLTDRYGDIPYSKALNGDVKVAYDKQKDIYTDLFKELTSAVSSFQSTGTAIKGDIIYKGDISKWKKLANSLRLILAMRLSKVDPATGKTQFMAALNDPAGIISSNADNFTITYANGFSNPYYNLASASQFAITKTIVDTLNGFNDPRLNLYGQAVNGKVKGVPYGLNRGNSLTWITANPDYSQAFDNTFKQINSPIVIIPAAYINLLRAEAALDPNYATGENALTLLTKGIQDSWSQWGATGDIVGYLANIGVSSGINKRAIQMQLWLALYGTTQNAWNEWRRTGVPVLTPAPDAVNLTKTIPRRYAYPTTEPNLNADAYNAAVGSFPYGGTDVHDNRVWWDK
ncbi:SusD-like starch-binding protein associating with outer membrane [Sediminibacterium magnilacihabitans]|nr:SusD-like starch-binding protein associating with outer membrane [Sediminibacterium magnilacihabitans]